MTSKDEEREELERIRKEAQELLLKIEREKRLERLRKEGPSY